MKYKYMIIHMPPEGYLWRALDEINKYGDHGWRVVTTPMSHGIYAILERPIPT